jgi:hypothetical protein
LTLYQSTMLEKSKWKIHKCPCMLVYLFLASKDSFDNLLRKQTWKNKINSKLKIYVILI